MNATRIPAIRQAVAAGDFGRALALWDEYASVIRTAIFRRECTSAQMAEAGELVEWSRRTAALARAHAQRRLDALRVAQRYSQAGPRTAARLRTCL